VILNGVDIKRSCSIEVCQHSTICSTSLYYRKHRRPDAATWFSVHICYTSKSVVRCHAAVTYS